MATEWSADFAYAIGLLATDGCLSSDGRHIDFTSKDIEQIHNFKKCLKIMNKITEKHNGRGQISYHVQFGNVSFYRFLTSIGIGPAKSLTLGELHIPTGYFFDFLRGCFDGDGCSYSYRDTRWKSSIMFYVAFASSSPIFIHWIKRTIRDLCGAQGHVTRVYNRHVLFQLKFSKHEAIKLVKNMYTSDCTHLSRKKLKIDQSFVMMTFRDSEVDLTG